MERIKNAIEKAKSQQGSQPTRRSPKPRVQEMPQPVVVGEDELGDIHYQQTRSVQLNPAHLEKSRIVALNKNDHTNWAFDSLRTQVLQKMEENGWRTLAIISPTPEAGKSVVAINLAISIAQQTQKTAMVVDFDLRRPKVGAYLGLPMEKSLIDLLDGSAELSEIIVNPGIPRLVVLPTRQPVAKSAEVLSSRKVEGLIKELRDRYDSRIVIFDLPPLLVADDAIVVLPQIDCVLMVVGNGMSSEAEIEETMHLLPATNLLGVVLNKVEVEAKSYYY